MEVTIGEEGLEQSWQGPFPETTPCVQPECKGEARIGFVAHEFETTPKSGKYVCNLHDNDPDGEGLWLHDACAVAVYFCKKCLNTTALYNQA